MIRRDPRSSSEVKGVGREMNASMSIIRFPLTEGDECVSNVCTDPSERAVLSGGSDVCSRLVFDVESIDASELSTNCL